MPVPPPQARPFRLIEAELLAAEGREAAAREIFTAGFEVADLREGDFRMRPTPPD